MSRREVGVSRVVVFLGITGSGKSFLARSFAKKHGIAYFNTDIERKRLAGISSNESAAGGVDGGIYSAGVSKEVYCRLLDLAREQLEHGYSRTVVLDGTYQRREERERLQRNLAGICDLYFIYCYCSEEVTRKRLQQRLYDPDAVSDGTWEIFQIQRERFEAPTELSPERLLRLDTDASLEYLIDRLSTFLDGSSR